jgi:restriction system protein
VNWIDALARVMKDKHATKGVLVTTSWLGKASGDSAANNGRIQIIEGRQLRSMLLKHLNLDVFTSLHSPPSSWEECDAS